MTQQMQVDEQVACNWCGLFSRPGAMCDTCGSPLVGGHILVLGDEGPAPRPPKRTRRRQPSKAAASSPAPTVFCAWCGLPSASGAQCQTCGSPLVGGHILFLPDEPPEAPAAASRPRKTKAGPKPRTKARVRSDAQAQAEVSAAVAPEAEAEAEAEAEVSAAAPPEISPDVAALLPKPKQPRPRRRSTRGPKAPPLPVRSTSAPGTEVEPLAPEPVAEPEAVVEVAPQPEIVPQLVEPEVVPEPHVDRAEVEVEASDEVLEPAAADVPAAEVEEVAVVALTAEPEKAAVVTPAAEPEPELEAEAEAAMEAAVGELLDSIALSLQAEDAEPVEAPGEPDSEGPAEGMEVAGDEAPAPAAVGDRSAPALVEADPSTHQAEEVHPDEAPAPDAAIAQAPEQVREGRRGLARIVRLPRARGANPRSTRRTTTPDAHTPPPDDGLSGTRVRRTRPTAPITPPDVAAAASPVPVTDAPIAPEPEPALSPVTGGRAAPVDEVVAGPQSEIAEIAEIAFEPEPEPEPVVAPAEGAAPDLGPIVAQAEPAVAKADPAVADLEPIPDADVSFADLFDTIRETPTGSIIKRSFDPVPPAADRLTAPRAHASAPASPSADRRISRRPAAARREPTARILPAGFDPVTDIEAWIRGPAPERTRPQMAVGTSAPSPVAEVPTPSPAADAPRPATPTASGRTRHEAAPTPPASGKRKRITCARCGQVSEQSLCEACREAFDALRSLSHDLAAGLE